MANHYTCAVPCPKCGGQMNLEGTGYLGTENNWKCSLGFLSGCDTLIPWNGELPPSEYPSTSQAEENSITGKVTCKHCGNGTMRIHPAKHFFDYEYECEKCGSIHFYDKQGNFALKQAGTKLDSVNVPIHAGPQHPNMVNYICKQFYSTHEKVPGRGEVHRSAEENLQKYLNANKVNPNHIISISTGAYSTTYGGYTIITLVHY